MHCLQITKDTKETGRCKKELVVTELFNFAVNDLDAKKKYARFSRKACSLQLNSL